MRVETSKHPESILSHLVERLRKGRERGKAIERRCDCKMCFLILKTRRVGRRKPCRCSQTNTEKWRNLKKK